MDDALEYPTSSPPKTSLEDLPPEESEELTSDEEDGGLDWTKLLPASARPVIPKRGEKDYEPRGQGGTNLQHHVLDRSRSAMYQTLRAQRTISSKAVSYGIWHPNLSRTQVTLARGIHFSTMGHSAPRPTLGKDGLEKIQKRLELLPEEAIYLIERGSLFCYKETALERGKVPGPKENLGAPMTVQQAFAEMIRHDDLSLEKFQVYAYLKRLGYVVTRTNPPSPYYPVPAPWDLSTSTQSVFTRIASFFSRPFSSLFQVFNWWNPVRFSWFFHHDKNYGSLFSSLRFLPAGHSVPLHQAPRKAESPYQIFFNLYKPGTPFKKSAPPQPDFQVVVVNARTTRIPSLQELTDLFDILPEVPIPPPRQRRQPPGAQTNTQPPSVATIATPPTVTASTTNTTNTISTTSTTTPEAPGSFLRQLISWAFPRAPESEAQPPRRGPNPFMALKHGKKLIVIAAVDAGNISFFRFAQGEFSEWPML